MEKALTYINGWTIVAYSAQLCRAFRIPFPTYAAFYKCVPDFNPTTEECSFGTLEELYKWCVEN